MQTGLTKYEPMMRVVTFSKQEYFFPKKNYEVFKQALESKKFIELQGSMVNVSSIDIVEPAGSTSDFIESRLRSESVELQRDVREEIRLYRANHKKKPTE